MMAGTLVDRVGDPALLVTDDDEYASDTLCDFFDRQGYRTYRAQSGQEAVEIARDAFLHFLVLDMHLPDFGGVEVFRIITIEKQVVVPCVFTSSTASKEDKLRALSARGFAYVPKPVDFGIMRHVVEQILDKFYPVRDE